MLKYVRYLVLATLLLLLSAGAASAAHKTMADLKDASGRNVGYAAFEETDTGISLFMLVGPVNLGTGKYNIEVYDTATCEGAGRQIGMVTLFNDGSGAVGYFGDPVNVQRERLQDRDGGAISVGDSVCGIFSYVPPAQPAPMPMPGNGMGSVTSQTPAADLRIALTNLLGEHVLLASAATGAALDGRTADFQAAAAALDANSVDLAAAIGSVYGDDARNAFLGLWRQHIGFFVDYTNGVATGNDAARRQALQSLADYSVDFSQFLASANANFDARALQASLQMHIATLTAVIDAQAMNNDALAYTNLRRAYMHMSDSALALATGISAQYPQQFAGNPAAPAADLRATLNSLSGEHAFLAAAATGAALGGRTAEFEAAAAALDANGVDLAAGIASVYGQATGDTFLAVWRQHIGFFVDYTLGVANNDRAARQQALDGLADYSVDTGIFLNGLNPNLPPAAVTALLQEHIATLTAVIDAQGANNPTATFTNLRMAYGHMQMTADALTEGIVQQFPANFR